MCLKSFNFGKNLVTRFGMLVKF
ncbi:hypothetical protein F383_11733 [Gossypium arboreum]|uniref:Uncharacterized protein n=1 Tax=Gossypium arboreum TaxID=29729 RepID=A0A0B0PW21_GOSAR|nr:hypothetical protein F383_11733 [Gossypium arboreum]